MTRRSPNQNKIEPLLELVPPPSRPLRCADDNSWARLRRTVNFPFPAEFLDYGRAYGTGEIEAGGYGLLIANPLDPAYPKWLLRKSKEMQTRGDPPHRRPTRFYPEDSGVVPFAENWSGDLVFFSSKRPARVATCPTGDPNELLFYRHGFVQFLVDLFSGTLKPEYFPNKGLQGKEPVFKKKAWLT